MTAFPPPHPVSFGGLSGWLHPGSGPRGIVVVGSFGYEGITAYRGLATLAAHLAAAGFPVLRFDLPGLGNGLDLSPDADASDAWLAAAESACAFLQARTGVEDITFLSHRFGALIAGAAAVRVPAAKAHIMLAPVATGRGFVRELAMIAATNPVIPSAAPDPDGGIHVIDHFVPLALQQNIAQLSLLKLPSAPARVLMLTDPDDPSAGPQMEKLQSHLERLGATVMHTPLPEIAHLRGEPEETRLSPAVRRAIVDWLSPAPATPAAPTAARPVPATWAVANPVAASDVIETTLRFGPNRSLAGVYCHRAQGPHASAHGNTAVLILNTGACPSAGHGRFGAELARRLAGEGIASLRFDIAGLGDSLPFHGDHPPKLYSTDRCVDVTAALDVLEARGHRHVTGVGICAGAYLCLHAGRADPRLRRLVLVNLQRFVWEDGLSVSTVRSAQIDYLGGFRQKIRSPTAWRNLLRRHKPQRVAKELLGRASLRAWSKVQPHLPRQLRLHQRIAETHQIIDDLRAHGTELHFIFGTRDLGVIELRRYYGHNGGRLAGRPGIRIDFVADCDHTFTTPHSKAFLLGKVIQGV